MILKKTTCFISYCHADVDRDSLDYLVEWMEELSEDRINIIYDDKLHVGYDINKFVKQLNTVDIVLVLMSKKYKEKVLNRDGWVYKEYKIIIQRYFEQQQNSKKDIDGKEIFESCDFDSKCQKFHLIPVLFSGTVESSLIEELSGLKYLNLLEFKAFRNKRSRLFLPEQLKTKYKKDILKIIDNALAANSLNSQFFKNSYKELFNFLFEQLKAEWQDSSVDENMIEAQKFLFVKTYSYQKIASQGGFILIGRKGSGKSTITTCLAQLNRDDYFGFMPIIGDNFNLEALFNFIDNEAVFSDVTTLSNLQDVFESAWVLFVYLCTMEIIAKSTYHKENKAFADSLSIIRNKINEIIQSNSDLIDSDKKSSLFTFSLNETIRFLNKSIESSRNDEKYFISDIISNFSYDKIILDVIGEDLLSSIYHCLDGLDRKILITLDGFDTKYDNYRRKSLYSYEQDDEVPERRTFIEIEWLRALLNVVLKIKLDHRRSNNLFILLDFCLTVPKDRFIEIKKIERDSYVYRGKAIEIRWSGIELSAVLRKRVEFYKGMNTDKDLPIHVRLNSALEETFPNVPKQVEITFGSRNFNMPIFLYILRHTFWRPRDILWYFAKIFAVSLDLQKKKITMTSEIVKRLVTEQTYEVIRSEFINEFKRVLFNVKKVIHLFMESKQIISFSDLSKKLSKIEFQFTHKKEPVVDFESKLRFLYEIGFLGVEASKDLINRFTLKSKFAFVFNEGNLPLRAMGTESFTKCNFIIHPVFCEYLSLDTAGLEFTLDFTWDYLYEMEAILFSQA